jgi:hypothetical protein
MLPLFSHVSHFAAMLLFALLVSMGLACLTRKTWAERARYAVRTFLLFIVIGAGIAWLMFPLSK